MAHRNDATAAGGTGRDQIPADPEVRNWRKRVSASRLWDIADALGVEIAFFFEGIKARPEASKAIENVPVDLMGDKEAMDLIRSYYSIPEDQRRRLFELARVLSDVA